MYFFEPIFGVHLPDGLIQGPGIITGWCIALLLLLLGSRNLSNDEIPKISLLTAVFFLTSLFPIQVPGGPKTHLLLNGLIGVILGQRAVLAIIEGLAVGIMLCYLGKVKPELLNLIGYKAIETSTISQIKPL